MDCGLTGGDRHLQYLFGEFGNIRNARAATAKKNARAKIVGESRLLQILGDELKVSSSRSDMIRRRCSTLITFMTRPKFIGNRYLLALALRVHDRRPVFQF